MAYIYCITNESNGKQYVGKTTCSVNKRWQEHCSDYTRERFEKRPLYDAMQKYGIDKFNIQTLQECDELELSSYEILWIEKLDTYKNGYNATLGGDGKILFDYKEIVRIYKQGNSLKNTSLQIGCCVDTVRKVIELYKIPRNKILSGNCQIPKQVIMLDLLGNEICTFNSYADAARWLVDNKFAKTYNGGVREKIGSCAKGKLKTAYKHRWKLVRT